MFKCDVDSINDDFGQSEIYFFMSLTLIQLNLLEITSKEFEKIKA